MPFPLRVAILPFLMLVGCAARQRLSQGTQLEGARGEVERTVEGDKVHVVVRVHNLLRPSAVGPDATAFVVWAEPVQGGSPRNLGALRLDEDENGELETSTTLRSFELFITAEPSSTDHEPWGEKLMWTEIDSGGS